MFRAIKLDLKSTVELRFQLYTQLRNLMKEGYLRPGFKLPSSRVLADELGVSRKTVREAYTQLHTEGYIESHDRSGTFVRMELEELEASKVLRTVKIGQAKQAKTFPKVAEKLSAYGNFAKSKRSAGFSLSDDVEISFLLNNSDVSNLPITQWAEVMNRELKRVDPSMLLQDPDPCGYLPLRRAIARYVLPNREVSCSEDQVVILSGYVQAMDLIARIHCESGDSVVFEDPCVPELRNTFLAYGVEALSIPVDSNGVSIEGLLSLSGKIERLKVAAVTPCHQLPTGAVLPLKRRVQLLDWARENGVLLIEDDYDSEFVSEGRPIPALKSSDSSDNVLYLGSLKRLLFPSISVSFLVVPVSLLNVYSKAAELSTNQPPVRFQAALANFISQGFLGRHLRRMKALYNQRRQALLQAIKLHIPNANVRGSSVGLHIVISVDSEQSDAELVKAARDKGVAIESTRRYYLKRPPKGEFILSFSELNDEGIEEGVKRLAEVFK